MKQANITCSKLLFDKLWSTYIHRSQHPIIMPFPFYLSFLPSLFSPLIVPLSFLFFLHPPLISLPSPPPSSTIASTPLPLLVPLPLPPPKICKATLASSAEPSARHGAQAESCHGQPCQGSQSGRLFQTTTW